MFRPRTRQIGIALASALCTLALTGLVPGSAAADPPGHRHHHGKGHGHGHHDDRADVRYVPVRPAWCPSSTYVVYDGNPYWYHVELGAFFGGTQLNVAFGERAPDGYGYWDPYCGQPFESVSVYSAHCAQQHHRPALRVVPVDDRYRSDPHTSVSFRIEYGSR